MKGGVEKKKNKHVVNKQPARHPGQLRGRAVTSVRGAGRGGTGAWGHRAGEQVRSDTTQLLRYHTAAQAPHSRTSCSGTTQLLRYHTAAQVPHSCSGTTHYNKLLRSDGPLWDGQQEGGETDENERGTTTLLSKYCDFIHWLHICLFTFGNSNSRYCKSATSILSQNLFFYSTFGI